MNQRNHNDPIHIMLTGLAGFLFAIAFLLLDFDSCTTSKDFVQLPQVTIWLTLMGLQTGLWFVLALPLLRALRPLGPFKRENIRQLVLLFLALVLMTIGYRFIRPDIRPLAWQDIKMPLLNLLGGSIGLLALHGIMLIYKRVHKLQNRIGAQRNQLRSVRYFLKLRNLLEQFLLAAGMIIGAATLTTGALRNAVIAYSHDPASFPRENVLLYGIFYSAFLALIYWPVHAKLLTLGRDLRELLVPIPTQKSDSWANWYSNRKALDDFLQLQSNPINSLTNGISILSPLAGSLIALLLGK